MRSSWRAAAAALFAHIAAGQVPFCAPGNDEVCFQVGITAAAQAANSGDMFFQMKAPTKYAWVGFGQGDGMVGANIFVMYQDGAGNVTISPRSGVGHIMPLYNPQGAQLTLLAGSGVVDDHMIANVRCSNCNSWNAGQGTANFDGTSGFLSAWLTGTFASSALDATITQHEGQVAYTVPLAGATIPTDANPFVASADTSTPTNGTTGTTGGHANSTSPVVITVVGTPDQTILSVHGVIMAVTFLALYPTGSFLMPFLRKWYIHAGWQMCAFVAMWIGFAFGVVLARDHGILFQQPHTIIGTVVCCLMVLQPVFGWFHHRHYVKHKNRTHISYVHIFYGRGLMILGAINGGLGLQLAQASMSLIIAYSVVAVIMSLFYASGPLIKHYRASAATPAKFEPSPISSPRPIVSPSSNISRPYGYGQDYNNADGPMRFYQNVQYVSPQPASPPRRPPRDDLQQGASGSPPQSYRPYMSPPSSRPPQRN